MNYKEETQPTGVDRQMRRTSHNSTYPKVAVQCSADTFAVLIDKYKKTTTNANPI